MIKYDKILKFLYIFNLITNEIMSKDKIILNSTHLVDIYGAENVNINFIKSYFKNLSITPRGDEVFLDGSETEIAKVKHAFKTISKFIENNSEISQNDIQQILLDSGAKSIKSQSNFDLNTDTLLVRKNGSAIVPKSVSQKNMINAILDNNLIFALGPAGTGKTYMAIALACKALKEQNVKKIILTRPAVEAGENLGFLPGDLYDKLSPYMKPLYDSLYDIFEKEKLNFYLKNNQIEIVPLAFMRGRTLDNAFVILDEAQNTTIQQMKMFLTRMGPSAQFVLCGDVSQIDLPKSQQSGLLHASNLLKDIKGVGIIKFSDKDVIRHKLVKSIIKAYKK